MHSPEAHHEARARKKERPSDTLTTAEKNHLQMVLLDRADLSEEEKLQWIGRFAERLHEMLEKSSTLRALVREDFDRAVETIEHLLQKNEDDVQQKMA